MSSYQGRRQDAPPAATQSREQMPEQPIAIRTKSTTTNKEQTANVSNNRTAEKLKHSTATGIKSPKPRSNGKTSQGNQEIRDSTKQNTTLPH